MEGPVTAPGLAWWLVTWETFSFFWSVFLHWISFFIFGVAVRSGSISAGCEVSAFRAPRSMSPSVNLLSNEQTNITWRSLPTFWSLSARADLLPDPSDEEGEREPGEPKQPQSFQSALPGSNTTTLLPLLPFLHSFPSFPLKLGTQGSWPKGLISSKGMSGAHSGALRMRWSSFYCTLISRGGGLLLKLCSTHAHTHAHPCTSIFARTWNAKMERIAQPLTLTLALPLTKP